MPLYPYQQRVRELLQSGKSVILQAPTGSGKTRAALAPFIEAFFDRPPDFFPRKCLYSVPTRVLANQFFSDYRYLAEKYGRLHKRDLTVSIQTGDRPEDRALESNLIFTTIDQTLSNFLNIPYSLGSGSANLNAGAILSSYLVFDELHLYDPDTTLPTTLEMLCMLKDITPFIVMTATFSSHMLEQLADLLNAVVVPESAQARQAMETLGSQVGKSRRFNAVDAPLTAEAVLDSVKQVRRTICICNTVKAAQNLFRSVKRALEIDGDRETRICLLHSRFYKKDRDEKEQWIKDQFGIPQTDYHGPPLILITTQVIEVGLDATCDVMHTELSPAASILQRAGRCARRKNETGEVHLYLPRDEDGHPDYTPYHLKNQPHKTQYGLQLCQTSWQAFNSDEFSGKHLNFGLEQKLIDQVHHDVDQAILDGIADTRHLQREDMLKTIQTLDQGMARRLIRDANTRFVVIHPSPETDENLIQNPWSYDGFTFSPGILAKAFTDFEEVVDEDDTPWLMKTAKRLETESYQSPEELPARLPAEYQWYSILDRSEIFSSPVLALHPTIAHYDTHIGMVLETSDGKHDLRKRPGTLRRTVCGYQKETYAEHVAGLYRSYLHNVNDPDSGAMRLALKDEVAHAVRRIEDHFGFSEGTLDLFLRALFACHDLGKLNLEWQRWAHDWQKLICQFHEGRDMSLAPDYMAAHTDFDGSKEQRRAQRELGRRPPHAGISAIAAGRLLEEVCHDSEHLWRAGITAIVRHHSADANGYIPFNCHPSARMVFVQALHNINLPMRLADIVTWFDDGMKSLDRGLINFHDLDQVLQYFLLVRVLRLADRRSQL